MWNTRGSIAAFVLACFTAISGPLWALAPPTGPSIVPPRERPDWPSGHPALCSERRPLCVHASSLTESASLTAVLRDTEDVAGTLSDVLRWPAPSADRNLGGNSAFDVYLEQQPAPWYRVVADLPLDYDFYDRSSAFALVTPNLPDACLRRAILGEAYTRAALFGIDVGANESLATAVSAFVASVAAPCDVARLASVDDYQASPQSAVSQEAIDRGRGAMLFPWFIQARYGTAYSVDLLHALWSVSSQHTPPGTLQWLNKPDFFDVLRSFQKDRQSTLSELLLEYAIARAFMGDRDDGQHMPESRPLGSAGRVRFEHRIPFASLPRTVMPAAPVEPTGATYVWVDLHGAPKNVSLGFRVQWETPSVFRFAFVSIGTTGAEIARYCPMTQERANVLEGNLENLADTPALLIVGANVGSLGEPFVFDPDEMPYEPQNYMLSLMPR